MRRVARSPALFPARFPALLPALLPALAMVVTTALLSGCAVQGPDYQRPAVELPADYPEAPANASGAAVAADWWKLFGDSTLNDLITAAQTRNADVRIATAQLEEAEAALREVGAALFPQVDASFANNRSRVSRLTALPNAQPLVRPERRLAASTAFEIDFWGRLARGTEAARAQAMASRYARDVVTLSLAGTTAQVYFALRSADAQLAIATTTFKAREETLQVIKARAAGGIASPLEVAQAQGALADAAIQMKEQERQRRLFEHQLGQLTGKLDLKMAPGTLAALPVPPVPPAGLPSALLERRPDIQVAEQNLRANNARIGIARAAMFPTISLTGSAGSQSGAFTDLLVAGSRIWSLGFGISLPIFDAGRIAARTEQAEARQRQSLASYQKALEAAFRETADALTNVEWTGAVEADLQTRLAAARDALEISRTRYQAGYSGYLEVLDAQRTANDAELALARNRQARLAYSVDLMKALGGGWTPGAKP